MTRNKEFKRRVRERMAKTGERYTAARRQLLANVGGPETVAGQTSDPLGINPATTAVRILLEASGVNLTERQLLLAGGGVGIGVFSFRYEEFSSLFLAGRHLWHDDLTFLQRLAERLQVGLEVHETGSRKRAEKDLFEALDKGPVIAFVDLATLGHRGGVEAYYLVVVREVDAARGVARIADLSDRLIEVPLATLADARAKHRKFRNRLLQVAAVPAQPPVLQAIDAGLSACAGGLVESPMKGFGSNFTLDSLSLLAKRMRGEGKDAWAQVFPPGPRLWGALRAIYEYVEHYGSGGGLLRPFFAEALESVEHLDTSPAAAAYAALGESWSSLAREALDPEVAEFAELAQLIDDDYAVYDALGPNAADELAALNANKRQLLANGFPLTEAEARALVERLADRVDELAAGERKAQRLLEESLP